MKAFRIKGQFKMGRNYSNFTKEIAANDEKAAREKTLSTIGSKHGVERKYITIEKVEAVDAKTITDPVAQKLLGV